MVSTMLDRTTIFTPNIAQHGDALMLLRSLPDGVAPLTWFDPQHRSTLDRLKFGNAGERQRGRAQLPAMSEEYIDTCCIEIARVLRPSGYLALWTDTYRLVEGHHLRIPRAALAPVDLIAWDNQRIGMGKRSRHRGDYVIVLQRPPLKARATWRDHSISSRWAEKIDLKRYPRKLYPHTKPIGLIKRLIAAVTEVGDLVVDPAAGSYTAMHAAHQLGRNFIGCDLAIKVAGERMPPLPSRRGVADCTAALSATPPLPTRTVE
jgi:site-specific DNA-methyltransferase (adenine-specific)